MVFPATWWQQVKLLSCILSKLHKVASQEIGREIGTIIGAYNIEGEIIGQTTPEIIGHQSKRWGARRKKDCALNRQQSMSQMTQHQLMPMTANCDELLGRGEQTLEAKQSTAYQKGRLARGLKNARPSLSKIGAFFLRGQYQLLDFPNPYQLKGLVWRFYSKGDFHF